MRNSTTGSKHTTPKGRLLSRPARIAALLEGLMSYALEQPEFAAALERFRHEHPQGVPTDEEARGFLEPFGRLGESAAVRNWVRASFMIWPPEYVSGLAAHCLCGPDVPELPPLEVRWFPLVVGTHTASLRDYREDFERVCAEAWEQYQRDHLLPALAGRKGRYGLPLREHVQWVWEGLAESRTWEAIAEASYCDVRTVTRACHEPLRLLEVDNC